jgi:ABC-type lipoprotein export system ATPase subunit
MRGKTIGFVFQRFHLVPYLSVLDNILVPALGTPQSDSRERAEELLERLNLGHRIKHLPAALSTGERQRTVIARAMLNRPQLLLADEPTGNLDEKNAQIVLSAMTEFADNGGAVLAVSHDPRATRTAHRTLSMDAGKLVDGEDTEESSED